MEIATEKVPVSFKDQLKLIKYDSPAFREQAILETRLSRRKQNDKTSSRTNVALLRNGHAEEQSGERNAVLPRYSANEMVNVCYAKMWRNCGRSVDEENDLRDAESRKENLLPSYFEKDLDKLQKLRLKSKSKSRRHVGQAEVQKWLESPEKFINFLTDLRRGQSDEEGSREVTEDSTDTKVFRNKNVPISETLEGVCSVDENENKSKTQVHFPNHVLLCAALHESEPKEVERVINSYQIDLNALTQATGYNYLHKTIANDQLKCSKVLVKNGIDVNRRDSQGVSPLALAVRLMNFKMVALLVESGANIHEYTKRRIEELDKVDQLSRSVLKVFEMDL